MAGLHTWRDRPLLVVGAGIMGAGIAQVAAQAGHEVLLHDARPGAAQEARTKLLATLDTLASKGRISFEEARHAGHRLRAVASLGEAAAAGLAVEVIVERLDAKRELLKSLEATLSEDAVLVSNTSSISITALANGLRRPQRLVGMHFFNPVPLMKLVEVVSGLQTDPSIAAAIFELAQRWGKVPVHARSTPGFIVNRIARPFYAESLALLQEQAAAPHVLDACLRAAGFRMGPCELMDLIGHDTNFAVTRSVFDANFGDRRFTPSLVQQELVDGGLLGRKTGRGFYVYEGGAPLVPPLPPAPEVPAAMGRRMSLHGQGGLIDAWARAFNERALAFSRTTASDWSGLHVDGAQLRLTDGRSAGELACAQRRPDVAVFDLSTDAMADGALAWSVAADASRGWRDEAGGWLALAGVRPLQVADTPGLVVARTLAMLVNEACDAVHQGVCTEEAADSAMKLGVNYPKGPFEWLAAWGAAPVADLLDRLDAHYRGERYRVSPLLRFRLQQRRSSA